MYLCVMMNAHFHQKLHKIKAFVFDVDGVFTNNHLISTESGPQPSISDAESFNRSRIFSQAICTALPLRSAVALAAEGEVLAIR